MQIHKHVAENEFFCLFVSTIKNKVQYATAEKVDVFKGLEGQDCYCLSFVWMQTLDFVSVSLSSFTFLKIYSKRREGF